MQTTNRLFWTSIIACLYCSFIGGWAMAMAFLMMASMFLCTELILKEMRNGKCKEGKPDQKSAVVETP